MREETGFTLIELAMVLFIIGMLMGGLLPPLTNRIEQENRVKTGDMLKDIEEALLGYAVVNGRLPCPDCPDGNLGSCTAVPAANRNDGIGDSLGGVCRSQSGNLPWVDLATHEYDAWRRHYTYRVTGEFSDSAAQTCGTPAVGVSFGLCSPGDINIYGSYSVPPYLSTPDVAAKVPAVVISHGKDAFESAQSVSQVENYDRNPINPDTGASILTAYTPASFSDGVFVYREYSRGGGTVEFDDIMFWISPSILMNRMIISGKLP